MNFWTFLFSLLAFDRIREIFRSSQTQSPPALLFMPRRWCANCSDRVFLGPDMAWVHFDPPTHPHQATPLLSGDEGEPMPDDSDPDPEYWNEEG